MGSSRWSSEDYSSYAKTTNYVSAPRAEVFRSSRLPASLDPSKIRVGAGPNQGKAIRESVDSDKNPNSTPIILALDVTASMGRYAELIAKESLPELMNRILEEKPVHDPHLMFMGIDDVHAYSQAPLQVSQFEADIKILEQLRDIYLVNGGGGNRSESYDLAWYFAAFKTVTDSYEKREKKGFLFTFGDEEAPYQDVSAEQLTSIFGEDGQVQPGTPKQFLDAAKKMYHVFHIVVEQGSFYQGSPTSVRKSWTKLLDNNVLFLKDFKNLPELVTATMRIANGQDMETVLSKAKNRESLEYAYSNSMRD